jgi:hypothetical protein
MGQIYLGFDFALVDVNRITDGTVYKLQLDNAVETREGLRPLMTTFTSY